MLWVLILSLALFLLNACSHIIVEEPSCYFPDGNIDYQGMVCNLTAVKTQKSASPCCRHFDQCYEDGRRNFKLLSIADTDAFYKGPVTKIGRGLECVLQALSFIDLFEHRSNRYYRQSCTDHTFKDPTCGQMCNQDPSEYSIIFQ